VYCLANAVQSVHLQPDSFFTDRSMQRISHFENLTIKIQGESVSIVDFPKNYQKKMLQEIANNIAFPHPLNNLIMGYLNPNPIVFSRQPTQPNGKELAEKANTAKKVS